MAADRRARRFDTFLTTEGPAARAAWTELPQTPWGWRVPREESVRVHRLRDQRAAYSGRGPW